MGILTCASHRMLVDARRWGALPWGHERFLHVQITGCSWMLVDGVLYHGTMSDSYLCSAQVLVDARGWGALPWSHGRFLPVQRTGCSWMLVDGVLSHGAMSDPYMRDLRAG